MFAVLGTEYGEPLLYSKYSNRPARAGAEVDKATNEGATPLFAAAQNGHTACVDRLLPGVIVVFWY